MSVFSNSQNGPPEFSTPVWEKDGENPKKRGGRERKEGGFGQGNTSGNKLEKGNFHLSEQESTWCRHFKFPFTVH